MNRPILTEDVARHCGLAAVVLAVASLVLAPLNALARMQTADGASDLTNPLASWWAQPTMDALQPVLLDFADADTVYLTYGKFNLLALLAVFACVLATRAGRPESISRTERWGWRLTVTSYAIMCLAQFLAYWVGLVDPGFGLMLLGMLIGIPANLLLGIALIRAHFRPRPAAWVIALELPLSIALVTVSTQALGIWPRMLAWGIVGWSLWRPDRRTGQLSSVGRRRR